MSQHRHRLSKHNTIQEGIEYMEARRESLERGRYGGQVRQLNVLLAVTHILKMMEDASKAEETE